MIHTDPAALVAGVGNAFGSIEGGFLNRVRSMRDLGHDWTQLSTSIEARDLSISTILLGILATVVATYALVRLFHAVLRWRSSIWRDLARVVVAALLASIAMFALLRFLVSDTEFRVALRLWVVAAALFCVMRAGLRGLLAPRARGLTLDVRRYQDTVSLAILWALAGMACVPMLRLFGAGLPLRDFVANVLIVVPVMAILILAYRRNRELIRLLIASPDTPSAYLRRLASIWPTAAITIIVMTLVAIETAVSLRLPLPPLATFVTLLLVLVWPHLDSAVADWSERGISSPSTAILTVALRKTFRFVVAIAVLCLLVYLWVLPFLVALGVGIPAIARTLAEIGFILLVAIFLWNAMSAVAGRVARLEGSSNTLVEVAGPRSRLGTLLPLLSAVAKITLLSVTVLTILIALGVNVWPIIGGLSIFGIAIGFGSQTLVKDIVSGLFFLIDDAFRLGEYIETPGAKGTVEKISVRSVSLRNARGALASVPYGQIGKVINFSRGWVIVKLVFRVAFDTDVDKVRKLFKTIGQEIMNDPELSHDVLEPFKSQGISDVEDGTLVIRGKFMAKAGKQFAAKKAVLAAVQKAFTENGIRAVPRPMTATPQP